MCLMRKFDPPSGLIDTFNNFLHQLVKVFSVLVTSVSKSDFITLFKRVSIILSLLQANHFIKKLLSSLLFEILLCLINLNLSKNFGVKPVFLTGLLLGEARKIKNSLIEFIMDVNNRKVRFVKFFYSLNLILVKSGKPVIVAESVVNTLPTHLLNDFLIILR